MACIRPSSTAGGSALRASNPNFAHPNGRGLQTKDVLRENQKYLDEIITLQLQFQGPGRVWQDERPREPKGRAVRPRKQLHLLTVVPAKNRQEAVKAVRVRALG